MGDSFLLEQSFAAMPAGEVSKQFGETFMTKLVDLPLGEWSGPIESVMACISFWSLIAATEHCPAMAEVRDTVKRDWVNSPGLYLQWDLIRSCLLSEIAISFSDVIVRNCIPRS
jgi:hypothetical protein